MAKVKISSLPERTTLQDSDVFVVENGLTYKTTKATLLSGTQETLVNQTNLKSVNGTTLLGSGDLDATPSTYIKNATVTNHTLTLTKKDNTTESFTANEVSGTNDGTNWQTLTIDGTTKNIPSGGGGGGSYTAGDNIDITGNVISVVVPRRITEGAITGAMETAKTTWNLDNISKLTFDNREFYIVDYDIDEDYLILMDTTSVNYPGANLTLTSSKPTRYTSSGIDNYLNTTYFNSLPTSLKTAILSSTITLYASDNITISTVGTITKNIYTPAGPVLSSTYRITEDKMLDLICRKNTTTTYISTTASSSYVGLYATTNNSSFVITDSNKSSYSGLQVVPVFKVTLSAFDIDGTLDDALEDKQNVDTLERDVKTFINAEYVNSLIANGNGTYY